jgi:hypothetical protein
VEAKWKRNNPLPLAETIIYKGILSVLVEVEANLPKNFHFVANLEHDSDGGDDVVKVLIGGLGLEAIRLSYIVEADLAVDAYEEMLTNPILDTGLQAEIEVLDLVLAVEFAIRIVVYVISVVRYTETEHRTKAESPSVNMILGQDRDIQENKIIRVCTILIRT